MKTELRILVAMALMSLLLSAASVRADERGRALPLSSAVRMALETLPQLDAGTLRVESAREQVRAERGRYAPSTTLRAGAALLQDTLAGQRIRTRSALVEARSDLTVYDFGRRRHAVRSSKANVQVAEADLETARFDAVEAVVELYLTVIRDQRRVKDAELSLSIQDRQVSVIQKLVERRARPEVDLQRAEVQRQAARDTVDVLRAEERRDRVELALAVGVDSLEGVELEVLQEGVLDWSFDDARTAGEAVKRRPEHEAVVANARVLDERASSSASALAPVLSVEGGAGFTRTLAARGPIETGDRVQASVGVFLTFTALDPTPWATQKAQRAEARAAERDAQAVRRALRAASLSALEERERALAALERARHLREGAQAALDAQQKRYELGASSLLELLAAQSLEQDARAQLIDAELVHDLSRARVLSRAGVLKDRIAAQSK